MKKAIFQVFIAFLGSAGLFAGENIVNFDGQKEIKSDFLYPLRNLETIKNKSASGIADENGPLAPHYDSVSAEETPSKGYYVIEPDPNAVYWFVATCTGENPDPFNVCLTYKLSVPDAGHSHTENIPAVDFIYGPYPQNFCRYNVSPDAEIRWYFHPTVFAARMSVRIFFSGSCEGQQDHTVYEKVSGFVSLVDAPDSGYILVGTTTAHPYNHQTTTTTAAGLKQIASEYKKECPQGKPLRYNDFSLPWGGLFDIGPTGSCFLDEEHTKPCQFWNPPHSTHRYGWNADVGFVNVPQECRAKLEEIFKRNGARANAEKDHWHLDFTPKTDKHYEEELRCH